MEQKRTFKKKAREAVVEMSVKLRNKLEISKGEWDESEIFHPDVNANRANSLYLLKLYRSIKSSNIEDPVLLELKVYRVNHV